MGLVVVVGLLGCRLLLRFRGLLLVQLGASQGETHVAPALAGLVLLVSARTFTCCCYFGAITQCPPRRSDRSDGME